MLLDYLDYKQAVKLLPEISTYPEKIKTIHIDEFSSISFIKEKGKWVLKDHLELIQKNYDSKTKRVIDKQVDHIAFNDLEHVYWNVLTGEVYQSVTTLISKAKPSFDTVYASLYKSLEAYDPKNFAFLKKNYPFKDIVNEYKKIILPEKFKELEKLSLELQATWKQKNYNACKKGTDIHEKFEKDLLKKKRFTFGKTTYFLCSQKEFFYNEVYHVFCPELLVYSDKYKVAGQIDLPIRKDDFFSVIDHKTNEKINFKNKFENMLSPVSELENCNFNHYSLQLDIYSILIEFMNNRFKGRHNFLNHITDFGAEYIECKNTRHQALKLLKGKEYIEQAGQQALQDLFYV